MTVPEYSLIPFEDSLQPTWDGVVTSSRNGNLLHLRDYINYHANRFDERSVIIRKDGKSLAVFPCNRVDDRLISHSGLTYAGLIYGNGFRAADALAVVELLGEYVRDQNCRTLSYKAIPHIFHRYPADEDLYALHRIGAQLVRRDLSAAVQLANRIKLSDSRKNTIRKSVKHGVVIREGDFLADFYSLLTVVLATHESRPVHSLDELEFLTTRFPGGIRLFGAFDQDHLLAAALIYDLGTVAHSQYMASSEDGKAVGALDFLLAHLLDVVFSDKQYFSFGISTEDQGRYLNEGLVFQKEGFGGRGVAHDFYEWNL